MPERKIKTTTEATTARVADITRELCCMTQGIKNPTIDTAILRREYAGCYQLLCSIMYSKQTANTWTGVCRVDFGYPEREKGACDIEVDTIETLACVASVSVGLGFFVRSKHFSLLSANPTILKNPYAKERQSNQLT